MGASRKPGLTARTAVSCAAAVLAAVVARSGAEPNPYQPLIDNSPFLTPAFKARLGQRDTVALSFIGYTRVGEEWFFGIYDKKADVGYWLKLNEEHATLKVEGFDAKAETIRLTVGGIGIDLTLDRGK